MLSLFVSIDAFSITRVSMPIEVDTAGMHGVFPPLGRNRRARIIQFPVYMTANTNSVYGGKNLDLIKVGAQAGTS